MGSCEKSLEADVSEDELAAVDAAFEQLLKAWHEASAALAVAISEQVDELRMYHLQRLNDEARTKVLEMFEALGRMPAQINAAPTNGMTTEESRDVPHAARAYGRISG